MKFRLHVLIAAGLFAGCVSLRAQFVWTGASSVNGSIADATNWPVGGPGAPVGNGTENLQFGDIVGAQTDILFPTSAFASLTFNGVSRPAYSVDPIAGSSVVTLNGALTVTGGNAVTFGPNLGLSLSSGIHPVDVADGTLLLIEGGISGAGGLSTVDSGILILYGPNTYSGGTTVDHGGTLGVGGSISHPGVDTVVGVTPGTTSALAILPGGHVSDNQGRIGLTDPTTVGGVDVDGSGTTWTNAGNLYVGELGSGVLAVTGTATVTSANTYVGNNAGGIGLVTVDGSTLTSTGQFYVGLLGTGTANLTDGAHVSDDVGSIGNNAGFGNSGTVTVDGAGTIWTNNTNLHIGDSTEGMLTITNTGTVNAADVYFGTYNTGAGTATIDGVGSVLNVSDAIYVGYAGSGHLILSNGGALNVVSGSGTVSLGFSSGSSGQLSIGDDGSPGGVVNAAAITTLAGTGVVDFETNSTSASPYYLTKDGTSTGVPVVITGPTKVVVDEGYNVLAGSNSYTGGTNLNSGTLVAAANFALGSGLVSFAGTPATLNVASGVTLSAPLDLSLGGTLAGNGTFATPVTIGNAAVISPGNSAGALTFSNGLTLAGGGALNFEVQLASGIAGTDYDLVNVPGGTLAVTATSGNRFTIFVQSLNGAGAAGNVSDFSPASAYLWTLFAASSPISGFSANEFAIDASGFSNSLGGGGFYVTESGNLIELGFTPVPEPSTYALLASGLGLVGLALRRSGAARPRKRIATANFRT